MNKIVTTLASAAMIAALSTVANAQGLGGELSGWGMYMLTTNGRDGGNTDCSSGSTNDFCANVGGFGFSGSLYLPIGNGLSLTGDALYEFHSDTANRDGTTPDTYDDHANYGQFGIHLTNESNAAMPWGGFVMMATGTNNAEDDTSGLIGAIGAEVKISDFVIQGGYMHTLVGDGKADVEGLRNMAFIGASREWQLGKGMLNTGLMLGNGDFEDDPDNNDTGNWVQLNLFYEAPLGNSNMYWFAGYQGDYVRVDRDATNFDKAIFTL